MERDIEMKIRETKYAEELFRCKKNPDAYMLFVYYKFLANVKYIWIPAFTRVVERYELVFGYKNPMCYTKAMDVLSAIRDVEDTEKMIENVLSTPNVIYMDSERVLSYMKMVNDVITRYANLCEQFIKYCLTDDVRSYFVSNQFGDLLYEIERTCDTLYNIANMSGSFCDKYNAILDYVIINLEYIAYKPKLRWRSGYNMLLWEFFETANLPRHLILSEISD